ncbi:MAG TPA: hypothetical protein VFY37_12025 [Solirubrobacterales bacterium]|nr:hypothetical protein [Solirubrobacterales bacterium]
MTGDTDGSSSKRRPSSRYSAFVGLAFIALIVIAAINTFESNEGGVLGADETQVGEPLPEFAVPELIGGEDADANVYQDDCESSEVPCPADEQRTPACRIDVPNVIRICDLFDRPLVLSFWFSTPAECPPTQDAVDNAARRYGGRVNFLSLAVRGDREELADIVAERGWELQVGWDRDGAVSNLYRVGVCPTVAFVLPGGILSEARVGSDELDQRQLDVAIERLIRESQRDAEAPQ